jgi:UDP-3-O-[3-hydroxymyristoyl] glucosamine N-acyltransferase
MQITAQELCNLLNGKLEGNPLAIITHPAKIEEGDNGAICFLANPKYKEHIYESNATVIVVNESEIFNQNIKATLIRVKDAYSAFTFLLNQFGSVINEKVGIEQPVFIDSTSIYGSDVYIGAFCYIGKNVRIGNKVKLYPHVTISDNSIIGDNTIIYSNVSIYHDSLIGNNCIIHSGTVIGCDGFGFAPQIDKTYKKIPQLGNVIIEDDVEIGANVSIDRATMGSTIIRKGVKLDNQIQIAHNVEIGEHTVIAAQSGVSGSTKIGKYCIVGGQVGFIGHINIADGTKINAQSGISKTITESDKAWSGSPAFEYASWLKSSVVFKSLPLFEKRIKKVEEFISTQEEKSNGR